MIKRSPGRMKHLDIRYLRMQEGYRNEKFQIAAIGTAVIWADAVTKGFAGPRHRLLAADFLNVVTDFLNVDTDFLNVGTDFLNVGTDFLNVGTDFLNKGTACTRHVFRTRMRRAHGASCAHTQRVSRRVEQRVSQRAEWCVSWRAERRVSRRAERRVSRRAKRRVSRRAEPRVFRRAE